jgi:hypothetical protein
MPLLQFVQAFAAKTILVSALNEAPFFRRQPDPVTLALGDVSHLAFEDGLTAGTIFCFVLTHAAGFCRLSGDIWIAIFPVC